MRTTPCDKFGPLFLMVYGSMRFNKQNANVLTPDTSQKQLYESGLRYTWMTRDSHPNHETWQRPDGVITADTTSMRTRFTKATTIQTLKVTKTFAKMRHQEVFGKSICTVFRKCSVCDCPIAFQDCVG